MSDIIKAPPSAQKQTSADIRNRLEAKSLAGRIKASAANSGTTIAAVSAQTIGIILDDSPSMDEYFIGTNETKWNILLKGVKNILLNINFLTTPVIVTTMGKCFELSQSSYPEELPLSFSIVETMMDITRKYHGTPLYNSIHHVLSKSNATKVILISDGCATDMMNEAIFNRKVPIDTVFIRGVNQRDNTIGEKALGEISKRSGGVFLCFDDSSSFIEALKYLSPAYREMLNNPTMRKMLGSKSEDF